MNPGIGVKVACIWKLTVHARWSHSNKHVSGRVISSTDIYCAQDSQMGKPGLCVWRVWINHVSFGNEPSRTDVGKTPMLWGCCRCKCDSILNNTWMDVGRWCSTLAQSVSASAWHISSANYGCFTLVPAVKSLMNYQSSMSFFIPVSFAFPACNIFIAMKLYKTSDHFWHLFV